MLVHLQELQPTLGFHVGPYAHLLFRGCYRRTVANPDRSPRESATGFGLIFSPPISPLMIYLSVLVWGFLFGISAHRLMPREFPVFPSGPTCLMLICSCEEDQPEYP